MSNPTPDTDEIQRIKKQITLADVGVIFSLFASVTTGSFVFGVMYGDVAENTKFREAAMEDMSRQREDLASIRTSIEYLVKESDLERELTRKKDH